MTEMKLRSPKVVAGRTLNLPGGNTKHYTYEGEVPEEMADYSQQVMGNAQARIAVTTDMAFKDYGNGVSVSVTLSLSCNQDDTTVNNVIQTLGSWSREYCKQQLSIAQDEYKQLTSGAPPVFKP
jgi:hypothetical protein